MDSILGNRVSIDLRLLFQRSCSRLTQFSLEVPPCFCLRNGMRNILLSFLSAIVLFTALNLQAGLSDVQITVSKSADEGDKVAGDVRGTAKEGVEVSYDITLVDTAFVDLSDLTADYIIFVERQKLGTKKDQDVVKRVKGTKSIPVLSKKEPQVLTTEKIRLEKSHVVGNLIYSDGARIKAEDNIKGVWIRVSQGGKVVAEYINPSTVRNRGWDEK